MRKIWRPLIWLPTILHNDYNMLAAKLSLEEQLSALASAAREVMHLPRLDELDEGMVELLSNQFHVDFYDPKLTVEDKRDLVRDAISWHKRKGTASAVEEVAKKVYRDAHVVEWFEYGGEPYFFRILQDISLDDEDTGKAMLDRLRAAVAESKNARSWLEFFGFLLVTEDQIEAAEDRRLDLTQVYYDFYDYRRNLDDHSGRTDYGSHGRNNHGGGLYRNGASMRSGSFGRGRHGRFQASDFEQLSFTLENRLVEQITPVDRNPFLVRMTPTVDQLECNDNLLLSMYDTRFELIEPTEHHIWQIDLTAGEEIQPLERAALLLQTSPTTDPINPVDRYDQLEIINAACDVHNARDGVDNFNLTTYTQDDVETLERGAERVYERVERNGNRYRNGSFTRTGDIITDFTF